MKRKTLKALKASIEHWEVNTKVKEVDEINTTWRACALCQLFFQNGCVGCPVAERTERFRCLDTPYVTAYLAAQNGDLKEFRAAAFDELAFLKSLLPEEEK